jgi:type I restriction enzyme S subunit
MLSKSPIKAFAKVGAGQGAPQKETDFSNEGYPFIRAGHLEDLLGGKDEMDLPKVNFKIATIYRLKLYQPNTIIFAKSGMSAMKGRIYKLRNPCYVVNHLATLELSEKAFPDFVVYTLRHFSPVRLINDSSYPSLKQSSIDAYEIPFPKEISDQIRIAEILNKAENLISQRKESIRLLDEYLKSTFLEMFGDPMRNEKGWKSKKLNELTKVGTGGTPSRKKEDVYYNGNVFWAKTTEVKGTYIFNTEEKITDIALKESNCKVYPVNTILLAMYGQGKTRGNVGLLMIESSTNQACAAIPPTDNINHIFLYELLKNSYEFIRSLARGGNQENLNLSIVGNIEIIIPSNDLQTRFAKIVENTESLKTQYQQSKHELENLYGSLSQRAFRGELSIKDEKLMMAAEPVAGYNQNNS